MADLPELSESAKRKLALQWKGLLERNSFTGEHLRWHDTQRESLSWGGKVGPVDGWRGRRGSFRVDERLVDREGIVPSVAIAKWQLYNLAMEYWRLWSVSAGCEIFAGWLDLLKGQVLEEVASIWKGHSEALDRWYERACAPAVEKELLLKVKEFQRWALSAELKALERAQNEELLGRLKGARLNALAATNGGGENQSARNWKSIEVSFLSDERVEIVNGSNTETRNYHELGFVDRRNGKPSRAWLVLRALAESGGSIRDGAKLGAAWPKVEKRIQEIRKVLRKHFGIAADPIPYVEGTGYQAGFKIGCSPSART